jgi:3-oxoacyl-[acyl-carrier protein] reductase
MLIARSAKHLADVVSHLEYRPNQRVLTMAIDLSHPVACDEVILQAKRHFDRLDVLVNNAAIQGPIGLSWETDWGEWQTTLQVNLFAPVALCRGAVSWMAKTGHGRIINLSGGGATGPRANFSAYATAKTALVRFSEILAEETRDLNICVNCIAPGPMDTNMISEILQAGAAAGEKEHEQALKVRQKGSASMERATALCIYLASQAGDGITGRLISAIWDPWEMLSTRRHELQQNDLYTLRRIVPKDRGLEWD